MNRAVVIFASAVGITWVVTTAAVLGSLATAVMANEDFGGGKESLTQFEGLRIEGFQKVGGGEHPPSSDDPSNRRPNDIRETTSFSPRPPRPADMPPLP